MSRARGLRNVLMSIDDKTGMARREHLEEYEDYRVGSPETVHIKAIKPKATDDPTPVSKAKLQEQSSRTVVKVRVKKSKR